MRLTSAEVQAKASAAALWCQHATDHGKAHGGKPWVYALIPASAITSGATLAALVANHRVKSA